MKKAVLFAVCLLSASFAVEAKTYVDNEFRMCDMKTYCDLDGKPLTGKIIEHKRNGSVLKADIKDGKMHGVVEHYYSDGSLQNVIEFENGLVHGTSKSYYPNGQLQSESTSKYEKRDGVSKSYYETGELESEIMMKDGQMDGWSKTFYKNGKIKQETLFEKGQLAGSAKSYYENGVLKTEDTLKGSYLKQSGTVKEYDEKGHLKSERVYQNGRELESDQTDKPNKQRMVFSHDKAEPKLQKDLQLKSDQKKVAKTTQRTNPIDAIIADKTNHVLGNPKGTFIVIEFFDYGDAFSKIMNKKMAEAIKKSDNIRWILLSTPIIKTTGYSDLVALYAYAAQKQGKFAEFHAAMANIQDKSPDGLKHLCEGVGLNMDQLQKDAFSEKADKKLKQNRKFAEAIGFSGTPMFVINGKVKQGAFSDDEMEEYIKQAEEMKQ